MKDCIDECITDTTNSPFTTVILPYTYTDGLDRKFEWNGWRFDVGVTREMTAREYQGYIVRQGLAIAMEGDFMATTESIENFRTQIRHIVSSIQNTNDLDVHMALVTAPSYVMQVCQRSYPGDYLAKALRDYIHVFGLMRSGHAMAVIIEETKSIIKGRGGEEPDFMLCSRKLCSLLDTTKQRTSYVTWGPDGKKLLKDGPPMRMYRSLKIIKSKAFSLDEGSAARDILRRRVRVGEFYNGCLTGLESVQLYNEDSDRFELLNIDTIWSSMADGNGMRCAATPRMAAGFTEYAKSRGSTTGHDNARGLMLLRCNIEHFMLGVVLGKGGMDHLGGTLWAQTEACVSDNECQHGVWYMTYKYHERAVVYDKVSLDY